MALFTKGTADGCRVVSHESSCSGWRPGEWLLNEGGRMGSTQRDGSLSGVDFSVNDHHKLLHIPFLLSELSADDKPNL